MIDLNISSSFHVDHVNFILNHHFDPPKPTSTPFSAKFQKDRTKTSISRDLSVSKKQSTSANNLIPNLNADNVSDIIPPKEKTVNQIGNKFLFSHDSNAIINSSLRTEEKQTRRHSLSAVTQLPGKMSQNSKQYKLSGFQSQQRVIVTNVVNQNDQMAQLTGNFSPILEKKTSSNEDKETPSSENEKERTSVRGFLEESKEPETANKTQKKLSEMMIRKSQIKPKYPKKQMIKEAESNRYVPSSTYLGRKKRGGRLGNRVIKQMHREKRKRWKNMMTRGMSTIRPVKMTPRMEYRSNLSNTSLNKTMIKFAQAGTDRHNTKLRDSLSFFNQVLESKKKKMFNSMFFE
jgi:hypothetical protein